MQGALAQGTSSEIKRKSGRPKSLDDVAIPDNSRQTRSNTSPYNRHCCIICQKEGGSTHMVALEETGVRMEDVAKNYSTKDFLYGLMPRMQ